MSDIAWAAGFFEAAGTVTMCGQRPRVAVKSQDEGAVRRFHAIVGKGVVYGPYGPYESQLGSTVHWIWCGDDEIVEQAIDLLLPWLGLRCRIKVAALMAALSFCRENDSDTVELRPSTALS